MDWDKEVIAQIEKAECKGCVKIKPDCNRITGEKCQFFWMRYNFALKDKRGRGKKMMSPFHEATALPKRLKALVWGDSGVGKTTFALQFPKPVLIDTEGGADLYAGAFKFSVIRTTEPDEIMKAIDWLLTNKHDYTTLIIDPISVYWEALQQKWSDIFFRQKKTSKGFKHEFYEFQPKDWLTIKAEWKELIRKLVMLDMTVIVTAREKTKYADGNLMQAIGETFDGEKSLPYTFDVVLQMYLDGKAQRRARVLKDRSNNLQKDFECSYDNFAKAFGEECFTREAKPVPMPIIPPEPVERVMPVKEYQESSATPNLPPCPHCKKTTLMVSKFNSEEIYCNKKAGGCGAKLPKAELLNGNQQQHTGGATTQQLQAIAALEMQAGISEVEMIQILAEGFEVRTVKELDEYKAGLLIDQLTQKAASRKHSRKKVAGTPESELIDEPEA